MTRISPILTFNWIRGLCVVAAVCSSTAGYSLTNKTPAMSLEQMTDTADEIVVGNVLARDTKIVGSHFETNYQVQVHENFKSTSDDLQQGKSFTLTLPGGALQEPPLTQYVMGVPYMFQGEEVVLFLTKGSGKNVDYPGKQRGATPSNLSKTYKVVGWNQGRFSVVTRKNSGEKIVTRVNMENYGVANGATAMKEVMEAVAEEKIPTVEANVARLEDMADEARQKDPLEVTAADGRKLKIERNVQKADVLKAMRDREALSVQKFADFKAQVQGFVADGN